MTLSYSLNYDEGNNYLYNDALVIYLFKTYLLKAFNTRDTVSYLE